MGLGSVTFCALAAKMQQNNMTTGSPFLIAVFNI
jgi:hypothetical protein